MIDYIKLARQAGIDVLEVESERASMWPATPEGLAQFAELVLEEAAKVCQSRYMGDQTREDLARDALKRCEQGQHPPLTAWETQQLIYAWLEREQMRRALHEIAEEWAGAECGEPVHAQEAYAIGLAKRMYSLAAEGLTPNTKLKDGYD
jgi:hypothetical protein